MMTCLVQEVSKSAYGLSLRYLDSQAMRDALRSAGNIVQPEEISAILSYVITDNSYEDLDGLHLVLLDDNTVKQIEWGYATSNNFYVSTDPTSEAMHKLMTGHKHQLVQSSAAWTTLCRQVSLSRRTACITRMNSCNFQCSPHTIFAMQSHAA